MGELISLAEHRARRAARAISEVSSAFYYDFACPFSYLAGERVERLLGGAAWHPAPLESSFTDAGSASRPNVSRARRVEAERAAAILRLPLSWPEGDGGDCRGLHRAAACAGELGSGAAFALAAMRLAFCGGFDLADPITLTEAAAAAGVPVELCLQAAEDPRWDAQLHGTERYLTAAGVTARPAICIGERWCAGPNAVIEAAAMRASSLDFGSRPAG